MTDSVSVRGNILPPGTMVMPLHWAVNRDPAIWSDPATFYPARFLDSETGNIIKENNLFPFQVGEIFPDINQIEMLKLSWQL